VGAVNIRSPYLESALRYVAVVVSVMSIFCVAYVGKFNEPLYFYSKEDTSETLHLQMIVHSCLDVVEERKKRWHDSAKFFLTYNLTNLHMLFTLTELYLQLPPSICTLDNFSQLKIIELMDATRIHTISSLLYAKMEHQILVG